MPHWPHTPFAQRIGVQLPIFQAPMLGVSTPDMAVAVCEAGGLGALAAASLPPEALVQAIRGLRDRTRKPFCVNFFVQEPGAPSDAEVQRATRRLQPYYAKLGVAQPASYRYGQSFAAQMEALLEVPPPGVSFTFDLASRAVVDSLHGAGCWVLGTATTVGEALAWQAVGADAVCMQGSEAGGHRGTFPASLEPIEESMTGTLALVPQAVDALSVPVVAAGGIMDGRGIAAALMLGAQAVQLGSAFLRCPEANTPQVWKAALGQRPTRVTRVFSGRPARGLVNAFMQELRSAEPEVPAYPVQNALTADLRAAARAAGDPELLSLWSGQAAGMSRALPAAELVRRLDAETRAVLAGA